MNIIDTALETKFSHRSRRYQMQRENQPPTMKIFIEYIVANRGVELTFTSPEKSRLAIGGCKQFITFNGT